MIISMITVIAPSPDDKRIFSVAKLIPGAVHRSRDVVTHASGKGANAARAAAISGAQVVLCTPAGSNLRSRLERQLVPLGIQLRLTPTQRQTRSCISIVEEGGRATEFIQEALPLDPDEADRFLREAILSIEAADGVLLAGSLPGGLSPAFYTACARRCVECAQPLVVDAQGWTLLAALAGAAAGKPLIAGEERRAQLRTATESRRKPVIVKINREEFSALHALFSGTNGSDDELAAMLHGLGADGVVISDGPHPVHAWWGERSVQYPVPAITATNPIGSGDAMSAGVLLAIVEGRTMHEAVERGIRMGTANALTLLPGEV
ncbi:MAG: hypothetical protein KFH87_12480 [Bacteroidetes bacterium]|nr:hypothetical protein [Bacteroidota bacterium]